VHRWVDSIGLRRTKAAQIYRKTGNLRAVQLLLGHTKLESTVRYLGIEVDDALLAEEGRTLTVGHRHHAKGRSRVNNLHHMPSAYV